MIVWGYPSARPHKSGNQLKGAEKTRGVTDIEPGCSDVLGHDRAGANDDLIADRDWKDGGICSDAYTIPKSCCSPKVRLFSGAPGNERIIDEHGAMRNEAFVSERYEEEAYASFIFDTSELRDQKISEALQIGLRLQGSCPFL